MVNNSRCCRLGPSRLRPGHDVLPATNTALSTVVAKESVPFKLAGAFPYVQVTG